MMGQPREKEKKATFRAGTHTVWCDQPTTRRCGTGRGALRGLSALRKLSHLSAAPGSHSPLRRVCPGWTSTRYPWSRLSVFHVLGDSARLQGKKRAGCRQTFDLFFLRFFCDFSLCLVSLDRKSLKGHFKISSVNENLCPAFYLGKKRKKTRFLKVRPPPPFMLFFF